jgi:hypothetical protein
MRAERLGRREDAWAFGEVLALGELGKERRRVSIFFQPAPSPTISVRRSWK